MRRRISPRWASSHPDALAACLVAAALFAGAAAFAAAGEGPPAARAAPAASAAEPQLLAAIDRLEPSLIAWRRDIHQNPELGNRELRTSKLVAAHLRSLGLEVRTGIAKTGVIGILRGSRPGRVLALRADMDALPVREQTGLPFASATISEYGFAKVPVMHACGHDAHTAMLMGAAQVLSAHRERLAGTVLFLFQPAEEGQPPGEPGGAKLVLAERALENPKPDAIFGLHVEPGRPGRIDIRRGPLLSSATTLRITLNGRQTHAGRPWEGTDLVNLAADVIKLVTTISARRVNVFELPNVVSIAMIEAAPAPNILPGTVKLAGTIRTFSPERLAFLEQAIRSGVEGLTAGYGASAQFDFEEVARVTGSDPALVDRILPALQRASGAAGVDDRALLRGAAEDFSYYLDAIPGVYYILGSTPNFTTLAAAPPNHSPFFDIDEAVLKIGVRAHVLSALEYLGD
jgi:amidohydrolase